VQAVQVMDICGTKINNMNTNIKGLHHITAIAGDAKRNLDFYTKVLGLRLVKKTVNFDDPGTYHFYYGNESGTPGTILTFFPWEGIRQGRAGTGMATDIGYSVPAGSLEFWQDRFREFKVKSDSPEEAFGEQLLPFRDPDGLRLKLVIPKNADDRTPWETPDIKASVATKGFHNVVLTLKQIEPTASVLTDILGYKLLSQEGNSYRYITEAVNNAAIIDLHHSPAEPAGINAGGTNHHIAFRVENDEVLMQYREKVLSKGLSITPKIDRDYFFSLYFREPGGVLFEIATDNPGFTIDEPLESLGSSLRLPKQYEAARTKIEQMLPVL
jgi:glyoxalase family protein